MRKMLLVVEDHDALRESLGAWLRSSFPECRICTVAGSSEAEVVSTAQSPAVILMDVGLPGMDRIEAARRLKAGVPDARVVLLGVYDTEAHRAAAHAAGASAYVTKRTMGSELIPMLSTWLRADSTLIPTLPAEGGLGSAEEVER